MGEIVSRINLSVDGADQAVKEIEKLKGAYDGVSQASSDISGSVGGTDPFQKALAPTEMRGRSNEHYASLSRAENRLQKNLGVGKATGAINATTSTMMSLGSGQGATGVGTGLQGAGSLLAGAGPIGAGLAIRSEERRVGKECRSRWSPYH